MKKDLSIIIPLYNEEESLPELCAWISKVVKAMGISYEIIMVDDGSSDNSWKIIQSLWEQYPVVRGYRFGRNYGKSAALDLGFQQCEGNVVITMDADLQDSPDEIPKLYDMIVNKGYHLISGWKQKRHDPISKTLPSKLFNKVTSIFSGIKLHDFNCGLKAYQGKVVKTIHLYGEMHRYIPVISKQNGFSKIGELVVEHRARKYGVTKFGLERFIYGFLDLLSISFVSRFQKRPMHFFGSLGTLSFMMGFCITVWLIWEKLHNLSLHIQTRDIVDQPLFFLSLVAIVVGVQLFLAGFLGEIMANTNKKEEYIITEEI
ncbi:MAG TPA: glycosyltransferase family 2 protein [Catalimonadaceae bacterium]|nr:glycosyltransferase family 2 protein [Catalimonadaceae bacterium]HPI10183.1 glycosyltransferase family 2 protein [Catalimonadaceae bacterium]